MVLGELFLERLTNRCVLYRDEMHFGPSAHRLMGVEIFESVNWLWLNGEEP